MSEPFSPQTAPQILKVMYPQGLEDLLIQEDAFYARAKKDRSAFTAFGGKGKFLEWHLGPGGGGSTNFGRAQANASASTLADPFVVRRKEYGVGRITTEMMRAAKENGPMAVKSAYKLLTEEAFYNCDQSISQSLIGDGTPRRGTTDTATVAMNTTTIHMTTASSMVNFERKMVVRAVDPATGIARAGSVVLDMVKQAQQKLVATTVWNVSIPAITKDDFIVRDGDEIDGRAVGVKFWIPDADPDPATDNTFGYARGRLPEREAGFRFIPGVGQLEDIIVAGCGAHKATGLPRMSNDRVLLMNPTRWSELERAYNGKVVAYVPIKEKPEVTFDSMKLNTATGMHSILSSPHVEEDRVYSLDMDGWEVWSLGSLPGILNEDGMTIRATSTADEYELRVGGFYNTVCTKPKDQAVFLLPTV